MGKLECVTVFIQADGLAEGFGVPGDPRGTGGAITHMAVFAKALAAMENYRVVLVTNENFTYPGIEVRGLWPGSNLKYLGIFFRKLRSRFLSVVYRGKGKKVALFPQVLDQRHLAIAKRAGCVTVSWVNGNFIVDDTPINKSLPRVHQMQRLLPEVDVIVVLSEYMAQLVRDRFGRAPFIIPGGVSEAPRELTERERTYAMWVGRPEPLKRAWAFAELAKRMPERKFLMVFRTHPVYLEAIDMIRFETRNLPNFEIMLDADEDQLRELYAGAVALVSTSASEGQGRTMFEAGAAGTDVVSFEINIDGTFDNGIWGYCANGDWAALDARLRELFESGGGSIEQRVAMQNYVRDNFGVQPMIDRFISMIEDVSGRN